MKKEYCVSYPSRSTRDMIYIDWDCKKLHFIGKENILLTKNFTEDDLYFIYSI